MFVLYYVSFYSMTKMDCVGKEKVIEMFKKGFTYQQISDEFKERYPGERRFSVPSIKLFCSSNGITSRIEAINIQTKRNIPILKTAIRNNHPCGYRLIDDMVGSAKT